MRTLRQKRLLRVTWLARDPACGGPSLASSGPAPRARKELNAQAGRTAAIDARRRSGRAARGAAGDAAHHPARRRAGHPAHRAGHGLVLPRVREGDTFNPAEIDLALKALFATVCSPT